MKNKDNSKEETLNKLFLHLKQRKSVQPKTAERKRVEKELKDKGDFLHNIIESSLDGIIATDDQGYIIRANHAFLRLLMYEEDEAVGKHISELSIRDEGVHELITGDSIAITKDYFDNQKAMIASLFEDGEIKNRKSYFARKDGKIVPCEQNISALYDEEGNINGAVGIIRDISERLRSERNIAEIRDFLDDIFKTAADGILVTDPNGFIIMINDSLEKITGYNKEDLIGKHTKTLRAKRKEYEEKGIEFAETLLKDGRAIRSDIPWLRKDGSLVYVERSAALLRNKAGEITGAVSTIRDITEKKKAEEELKESKEYLGNLIDASLDCIMVSDKTGYITKVNKYFLNLLGYSADEVIGKHVMECSPMVAEGTYECTTGEILKIGSEYVDDAKNKVEILLKEGKVTNWETYYFRKDRKIVPVEQNIVCLYNNHGERNGAVAIIRDITKRKEAEAELIKIQDHLNNIIESSLDSIVLTNNKGYVTRTNKSFFKLLGYTEESQVIGKHIAEFSPIEAGTYESVMGESVKIDKESLDNILTSMSKLTKEGKVSNLEFYLIRTDKKVISVEENIVNLYDKEGERTGTVGIIRDTTERKKFEDALKRSEGKYQNLIENANDGVVSVDKDGTIITINKRLEEMYGYTHDELLGQSVLLLVPPNRREDQKKALEKLKTSNKVEMFRSTLETKAFSKDGKEFPVEASMFGSEIDGEYILTSFIRDISERKKMEQKLLQAEKLKSLGELSGGVAHDFNNVLAAILGRVQLLKIQLNLPVEKEGKRKSSLELKKGLEIIEKASLDGAETVRRIQEFSKKRANDKNFTMTDINQLIDDALDFTKVRWKNDAEAKGITIAIQKEYSPLPPTSGSASELREVFTNLINNSIDAMPQGGRITIKTFEKNGHLSISIADTGIGISEDIKNRIFDPFFTTKGVQSTGLGMSVSYGIINRHGGTIQVDSKGGKGTTFTVTFPISYNTLAKEEEKTKPMPEEKRQSSILVIEDEEEVRNLLADILIESGHHVETARDGSQGIEMFKKNDYDLVFTDLGMPGMSGWQVAEKIKNINRNIPVAIITGWNVEMKESEMREKGVNLIVNKPFEVNRVLNLVQEGMKLKEQFEAA